MALLMQVPCMTGPKNVQMVNQKALICVIKHEAYNLSQQSTRNIKLVKDNQWINQKGTVKLSISQESIGYVIGSVCQIDSQHVAAEMKALRTEICQ